MVGDLCRQRQRHLSRAPNKVRRPRQDDETHDRPGHRSHEVRPARQPEGPKLAKQAHEETEDEDALPVGAAALAAVGCGLWEDYDKIDKIHKTIEVVEPNKENNRKYENLLPVFNLAAEYQAKIGDALQDINL